MGFIQSQRRPQDAAEGTQAEEIAERFIPAQFLAAQAEHAQSESDEDSGQQT